jgi:Txe/YoeB family toxin of Txe-Axe toxin-antitoxin module
MMASERFFIYTPLCGTVYLGNELTQNSRRINQQRRMLYRPLHSPPFTRTEKVENCAWLETMVSTIPIEPFQKCTKPEFSISH